MTRTVSCLHLDLGEMMFLMLSVYACLHADLESFFLFVFVLATTLVAANDVKIEMKLTALNIHHVPLSLFTDQALPSSLHDTMSAHDGQFSPGRGLSPNAMELGRQITLARQLMQKQKQAEFRANAFFNKRSFMRPAAHILPMKKGTHCKSTIPPPDKQALLLALKVSD